MNLYLDVFVESAIAASFIPFINDPTFFAMKSYSESGYDFDMQLAVLLATLGSAVGATFCFVVGCWIKKMYRIGGNQKLSEEKYNKAAKFFSKNMTVLMLVTWLPMLKFLPLIGGFLGARAKVILPLVVIGKAAYYSYYGLM